MKRFKLTMEWLIAISVALWVFGCIFAMIVYVPLQVMTNSACLAHGYPQAQLGITLTRYCVKRAENTDIVTALAELEGK